jgi:hypothetical protein
VNGWSPNQLRHTAPTKIRREFGIEAAQNTLGHATVDVCLYFFRNRLELFGPRPTMPCR